MNCRSCRPREQGIHARTAPLVRDCLASCIRSRWVLIVARARGCDRCRSPHSHLLSSAPLRARLPPLNARSTITASLLLLSRATPRQPFLEPGRTLGPPPLAISKRQAQLPCEALPSATGRHRRSPPPLSGRWRVLRVLTPHALPSPDERTPASHHRPHKSPICNKDPHGWDDCRLFASPFCREWRLGQGGPRVPRHACDRRSLNQPRSRPARHLPHERPAVEESGQARRHPTRLTPTHARTSARTTDARSSVQQGERRGEGRAGGPDRRCRGGGAADGREVERRPRRNAGLALVFRVTRGGVFLGWQGARLIGSGAPKL